MSSVYNYQLCEDLHKPCERGTICEKAHIRILELYPNAECLELYVNKQKRIRAKWSIDRPDQAAFFLESLSIVNRNHKIWIDSGCDRDVYYALPPTQRPLHYIEVVKVKVNGKVIKNIIK
jgi:hypothetical protein